MCLFCTILKQKMILKNSVLISYTQKVLCSCVIKIFLIKINRLLITYL